MARPKAKELTERELEVMHQFWERGEMTIADAQELLNRGGRELAYTTVATLVRILCDKDFLQQTTDQRPHQFKPRRSFKEVSGSMVKDLVQRLFGGSREALLVHLIEGDSLNESELLALQKIVSETKPNGEEDSCERS